MVEVLETPRSVDELYLARGDEVSQMRPVMTGDVFRSVDIPGCERVDGDEDLLAMVVSHPCSMRTGHRLNARLQVVRVARGSVTSLSAWSKTPYDRMPLPRLTAPPDDDLNEREDPEAEAQLQEEESAFEALLDLRGRVPSSALLLQNRIACLTEEGVAHLHQRMAHFDTRHAPDIEKLMQACDAVFAEAELAQEWNEKLISTSTDAEALVRELETLAEAFEEELSKKREVPDKPTARYILRDDLKSPRKKHAARREMAKILNARCKEQAEAG